ncbi:hypothetical protein [Mesorhizobium sp. Root552]|uniref:hypothetical protein n=1 Tax=Mesorhizobium sp. Root552 TaxID=1736555 RepID=UPI000AB11614|nr:hypothetical protein [Mesorhizobium sp. Root552]
MWQAAFRRLPQHRAHGLTDDAHVHLTADEVDAGGLPQWAWKLILVLRDAEDRIVASRHECDFPRHPLAVFRVDIRCSEDDHAPVRIRNMREAESVIPRERIAVACRNLARKDETLFEQVEEHLLESRHPSGDGHDGSGKAKRLQDLGERHYAHGDRAGKKQHRGDVRRPERFRRLANGT